jgi:hypothetical protein
MKHTSSMYGQLAKRSLNAFVRATTAASAAIIISASSIGLSATGLIGVASFSIVTTTPAHARCFIAGQARDDISDGDCVEAQRTGCVRRLLTPDQYTNCLAANRNKRPSCVLNGVVRDDLSAQDCQEAMATGCVRARLTPAQYQSCLDAQPVRR